MPSPVIRRLLAAGVVLALASGLAACGDDDKSGGSGDKVTVRLGYFPNITHASAVVGVQEGIFAKELGDNKLQTKTFNAGPAAIEALFSGAIDATYVGPSPTVNAYVKSKGKALKVISGAASGGAALVVKAGINSPEDLKGKKIATPQLGNTQDVALRYWLDQKGLKTTKEGGGDVKILPQDNAVTSDAFATGAIDGAWVPEPTVSKLVAAGGKVLVDERTLWPDGKFVVTNLVVRTEFLKQHPDAVKDLLRGQVKANDLLVKEPAKAQKIVSEAIGKLSGKPLKLSLVESAWKTIDFTNDPLSSTLIEGAQHAVTVGLLAKPDLDGLYDLKLLNEVLTDAGEPTVKQP